MNMNSIAPVQPQRSQPRGRLGRPWWSLLVAAALLEGVPCPAAQSDPPEKMTYQGFLVDANGVPLASNSPANFEVIFRIYDQSSGGNRLWSEKQIVTVDRGHFSVLLGEGTEVPGESRPALSQIFGGAPLAGNAAERYLGITVALNGSPTEIQPRLQLLPAPYAYLAKYATTLVKHNGEPLVVAGTGDSLVVTGTVFAAQFTGSGSGLTNLDASRITTGTLPDARLDANVARRNQFNTFTTDNQINGHLRVGELVNAPPTSVPGWGKALIFSGGPDMSQGWNNDNSDPLWIARYNAAENQSELRVIIGDDPGGGGARDKLVVGTYSGVGADFTQVGGVFTEIFSVLSDGDIGVKRYIWAPGLLSGTGSAVVRRPDGMLVVSTSSRRFKENIKPFHGDFARILELEPVSFTRPDAPNELEIGYIAEDLHAMGLTQLLTYDQQGLPYSIHYDKICIYLTQLLKDHQARLKDLGATCSQQAAVIQQQRAELDQLKARLDALERHLRFSQQAWPNATRGDSASATALDDLTGEASSVQEQAR